MPREIKSTSDVVTLKAAPPPASIDDFKDRLVKLIPSEIVTAYVTIQGLIAGSANTGGNKETLIWVVFGLLLVLTPVYLYFITNVRKWGQIIFTTIAFVIWVIAIGSPIGTIMGYSSVFIGSILLVIYTLLIPLFYKGE